MLGHPPIETLDDLVAHALYILNDLMELFGIEWPGGTDAATPRHHSTVNWRRSAREPAAPAGAFCGIDMLEGNRRLTLPWSGRRCWICFG